MISPRQTRIYEHIRGVIQSTGRPPTNAELRQHFRIRSSASVHAHIVALEREGLIKRIPNISRGIVLTGEPMSAGVVVPESYNAVDGRSHLK